MSNEEKKDENKVKLYIPNENELPQEPFFYAEFFNHRVLHCSFVVVLGEGS